MRLWRYSWHLVTRFFGSVTSKPLSPREQNVVAAVLQEGEARLFWRQQAVDQRHAWVVAQSVQRSLGENPDAVAAALLHDVGKVHSGLGPVARSLATVLDHLGIPMPSRWRRYREHEALGSADLAENGARPLAIAFAAGTPSGDPAVWDALVDADNGQTRSAESSGTGPNRNSMPPEVRR